MCDRCISVFKANDYRVNVGNFLFLPLNAQTHIEKLILSHLLVKSWMGLLPHLVTLIGKKEKLL